MLIPIACLMAVLCQIPLYAQGFTETDYQFLDEPVSGEVDVRAQVHIGDGWPSESLGRIVFCYSDDSNHLYVQIHEGGATLGEVRDGVDEVLATASAWPEPAQKGLYQIVIKRRGWPIRVLCDQRTILTAYDQFAPGEKIGAAARGIRIRDLHSQPIGEMVFEDDFARPAGEPNPWQTLTGSWRTSLPEARDRATEAAKSANPFSYRAMGARALAVTGSSFWDGYEVRAAVKPAAGGMVGVAFYVQDKDNYYVLRVDAIEDDKDATGARTELVKVEGGKATVLAEGSQALAVGKWHELAVRAHDGLLQGLVDGEVICQVRDETFAGGQIGLYTENCAKALFDDVALERYHQFTDSYAQAGTMPVEQVAGDWTLYEGRLCGHPKQPGLTAIGLTGCADWENYTFAADILPWTASGAGLYFGCTGPRDYYLFRWGTDHTNPTQSVQQLWKVKDGQGQVLSERRASLDRKTTHHVQATLDRSYLAISVNGERVLDAVDTTRASVGRVGYYVEGTAEGVAAFDNMRVEFTELPKEPVSITAQFSKENTMANWARPGASWKPLNGRLYAYTLPVWGDFDIRLKLRYLIRKSGSIGLRLGADNDALKETEACLQVTSEKGSSQVQCTAPGGDGQGMAGSAVSEEDEPLLELERRGGRVVASLDGQPMAWAKAPDGTVAPAVGIKLEGVGVNTNSITLTSPNIIDSSFSGAPTQWRSQSGVWDVSDRWHCQPQWSWLCGRDAETPLLWSKRAFTGDIVFEFWAAVMMDLRSGPGYSHPSDLNGIICGDGQNLCSGYAFVLAGDKNTKSKIIRKGEVVREAAVKFINPTSGNVNFHRHWFHCRVEKTGSRITFLVDKRKVLELEYDDPSPLSGGHVGMWTHERNGMLIARTRTAFK